MEPEDTARVLVAVLAHPRDLSLLREQRWYRIPLARAPRDLAADYLAFYLTSAFGPERWAVRYYAAIRSYQLVTRLCLLPDQPKHPRADELYYRIEIDELQALEPPVPARSFRRLTFIATSWGQLRRAHDVTELWHPPEDQIVPDDSVWAAGIAGRSLG
jgi:hypothetical protein